VFWNVIVVCGSSTPTAGSWSRHVAVSGGFPKEAGELRELMMQLGAAAMQVVSAGSAEQRKRAVEHLTEARRGLYRILAEDDPGEE